MKRTIVTALAAALLITPAADAAQARGFGGVIGGIIAGAIIAHSYRHAYRPRYYARPRVRTVQRTYPTKPNLAHKCMGGCSAPHTQPGYME
jgi:hypothetical protein